jgi:hypothetical protein
MASTAITTAGTVLAIDNALPATYNQAGFEALSYDTVGELTEIGEFGKEYALVTHNPINDRQTYKFKGSYNNGSITLQMASDEDDAGQAVVITALGSDTSVSFKVTHQDATVDYFTGKVMSYKKNVGSSDSILSASVTVELDSDVVNV